jgi:hypothetical protein
MVGISEKATTFKGKLKLWTRKIQEGKTASFSTLNRILEDDHSKFIGIQDIIVQLLEKSTSEFNNYVLENVSK